MKFKPFLIGTFFNDRLMVDVGWFRGEPFKLFSLSIVDFADDVDLLTIFNIQIAKLIVSICYDISED